jgi:hypothetical protein
MCKIGKYFMYVCLATTVCGHKRKDKKSGLPICMAKHMDKTGSVQCSQIYQISYAYIGTYKPTIAELRLKARGKY